MKIKDPIERKRILVLNVSLLLIFAILIGGGYAVEGVDFAKGTLIGCIVVAINFFVSQRLVGQLIIEKSVHPVLLLVYFFKLGASVLILFVAVVKYNFDKVGLMLGLSSIIFAVVLSTLVRKTPEIEDD